MFEDSLCWGKPYRSGLHVSTCRLGNRHTSMYKLVQTNNQYVCVCVFKDQL